MQFFADTADVELIRELHKTHRLDGVTTNPSLIAKTGRRITDVIAEICDIIDGPVSAEVTAVDTENMVRQGRLLAEIADHVAVKLPLTKDGLTACHTLSQQGIMVNVTLCFSPMQAMMAARAGATFVSPFVGRLDDIGLHGMDLIQDIAELFDLHDMQTEVLAASIRHTEHVLGAAKAGAHIVTIPPKLFDALLHHPLTQAGLEQFLDDWQRAGGQEL
ncbi:MAG: fructose-6-phosphate aldolase [Alphaproteobacteria bacterium]|jgi:transaldolase|nr:fructose-6-phosphate aldolase [Alphaproteobacteria bacterium]